MRSRLRVLLLAVVTLACSDDDGGGRWLLLDREERSGRNRICVYRDWPGEHVVTVPSWELCDPALEVDGE